MLHLHASMGKKKYRWRAWGTIAAAVALGLFCHTILAILQENSANKHTRNKTYTARKNNAWNKYVVDSTIALLKIPVPIIPCSLMAWVAKSACASPLVWPAWTK